jgi:hypothetical protein
VSCRGDTKSVWNRPNINKPAARPSGRTRTPVKLHVRYNKSMKYAERIVTREILGGALARRPSFVRGRARICFSGNPRISALQLLLSACMHSHAAHLLLYRCRYVACFCLAEASIMLSNMDNQPVKVKSRAIPMVRK